MSMPIIEVENLSKCYTIGKRESYGSLRDEIMEAITSPIKRLRLSLWGNGRPADNNDDNIIWALKDVSFEVQEGEVLGIIGRNGAGKSTLLKILSRITEPTSGRVIMRGRVASLLEVGTGFHPELTGRENIYLNGTLLGMTRSEIKAKFDEIVTFAEIEKFLDTPIKRYSSGMYVRLAFAVAAHLEPEILVIDEVLAVGDAAFQKKCLGKMGEVAKGGRTVLFVSHNMGAIEQLCMAVLLLDNGRIKRMDTDVVSIIKDYVFQSDVVGYSSEWINSTGSEYRNDYFTPIEFFISDRNGNRVQTSVRNDSEIWINIVGEVKKFDPSLYISFNVYTEDGINLFGTAYTDNHPDGWPVLKKGKVLLKCKMPKNMLNEGSYKIELYIGLLNKEWFCQNGQKTPTVFLEIKGGLSQSPYWTQKRLGLLAPILEWTN